MHRALPAFNCELRLCCYRGRTNGARLAPHRSYAEHSTAHRCLATPLTPITFSAHELPGIATAVIQGRTSQSMNSQRSIVWFRKGLRLHDNPALLEACKGAQYLYPIFILDPWFLTPERVGVNRLQFLLESLQDLDAGLRARGSRLLVLRGKPQEVLPQVFKDWRITKLCFESDTEPYAKVRDAAVKELAALQGVAVHTPVSHTIYDPDAVVAITKTAPLTYKGFEKAIERLGPAPAPVEDPPVQLPGPAAGAPGTDEAACGVPTLKELNYTETPTSPFKGGETAALARMADYLADKDWVARFEKPKGNPAALTRPATTVLSPYLKFGCLSARLLHAQLTQIYREKTNHTKPPVSLRGQLLWREFFYTCAAHTPSFDRMVGNAVCKQIPWEDDPVFLKAWTDGQTGYPWIDAIMRQLKEQGWMHHLARHSVACFLTRGDLWCSWEAGAAVFDRLLLDADWSINNGNWMWLSASAFFTQYFRVYSPVSFGKQYDPQGDYIKRFVPELKNMPSKYIFEPWTAPKEVQQKAQCIVGKDYPRPIVDHAVVSKANMAKMKAAYGAAKEGALQPEVAAATTTAAQAAPKGAGKSRKAAVAVGTAAKKTKVAG